MTMSCAKRPKNHFPQAIPHRTRRRPGRASNAAILIPLLAAATLAARRDHAGAAWQTAAPAPAVSVWYRGVPAGVPRLDDLAVIRAHGFDGVVWPESHAQSTAAMQRLAAVVDLVVITRAAPSLLTPESALAPGAFADVAVTATAAPIAPALSWRAIAHGARQIAYDAGEPAGSGVVDRSGKPQPWVAAAASLSRQFTFNRRLLDSVRQGPAVSFEGAQPRALDVMLLDAGRSWLLVATNASREEVNAIVRLPAGVPPALWLELVDGTNISMLNQRDGPRWTLTMAPGAARIYMIDK